MEPIQRELWKHCSTKLVFWSLSCSLWYQSIITHQTKLLFHLTNQHIITSSLQTHQSQTSGVFGLSIFHIIMIWSVTNVTQTIARCNLSESRSEVRVRFTRVYLSISCNTSATCAGQAKKTLKHICENTDTNTFSCDLPSRQRTSTLPSWKNSGWRGWG